MSICLSVRLSLKRCGRGAAATTGVTYVSPVKNPPSVKFTLAAGAYAPHLLKGITILASKQALIEVVAKMAK